MRVAASLLVLALLPSVAPAQDCDSLRFDSGGSTLTGCMYAAAAPHPATMVFTQGFMDTGDIWGLGRALSRQGINVFTFDFRGCFGSGGKQGLMNSQDDIGAALAFLATPAIRLRYRIDSAAIIVGGYSYGGHMSMLYAAHHPAVRRVISVSGGDLGILARLVRANDSVRKQYEAAFDAMRRPAGPVDFAYPEPLTELLRNQAFFSILDQSDRLRDTDVLMTGGLDDRVVSMEQFQLPIYRKLRRNPGQRLRFIVYQTGHSYRGVSDQLIRDMAAWINGN